MKDANYIKLINEIAKQNVVELDKFLQLALSSNYGYYTNKMPFFSEEFESSGDFITSCELSQIFGELIGLFLGNNYLSFSNTPEINLVELGAGRGTLLKDILRVTKNIDNFHNKINLHILEINPMLKQMQIEALKDYPNILNKTHWYDNIDELYNDLSSGYFANKPTFIYSNEFFDALPIKQYVYTNNQFCEICVRFNKDSNKLEYVLKPIVQESFFNNKLAINLEQNHIIEVSPLGQNIYTKLLKIIKKNSGLILTIDYGYEKPTGLSSLRGYKSNQLLNALEILQNATFCDITYNVNFASLQAIAKDLNVNSYNIISQSEFLLDLGFNIRLQSLLNTLNPDSQEYKDFLTTANLLVDNEEMGGKFKVMLHSHNMVDIYGFSKIND